MPPTLNFLLLIMLKYCLGCHEVEKIVTEPVKNPYYKYNPKTYRNELIKTRNVTVSVEIVCTQLSTLKMIDYTYQEKSYKQFLKIVDSNISTIQPLELNKFTTVTKLELKSVEIGTILPGAFTGLTRLQELYLNNNKLEEILNGVFNSLHILQILDLSNNRIHQIDKYSFMGVANLEVLLLKQNNITVIEEGTFETLQHLKVLNLSQNPLEKLPLTELSNIETLNLSETNLTKMDADLSNLTMKLFDLSKCKLTEVDFSLFPKLDRIILSNNKINLVKNCQNLDSMYIELDCNEIKTVDYFIDALVLNFSHNQFEKLETMFRDVKFLNTLDFSYNRISKIDRLFFQNLTALKNLFLQHNSISQIDPILFNSLTNLQVLDLSQNQIRDFQFGTFDSLVKLDILNISSNRLLDLHQYTFNALSHLTELYFDDNQISALNVEDLLSHTTFLKIVSLDHNLWNCKELVAINRKFNQIRNVKIISGNSYDVENFRGIACSSSGTVKTQNSKTQNITVDFSKMQQFFDEFPHSKFVGYFEKDYSESNFFKFFDKYRYFVTKNSSDATSDKVTGIQFSPVEKSDKILIAHLMFLFVITTLLLVNFYFRFQLIRKLKMSSASQIELC